MKRSERLKKLGWFIPLRLASFVILFAVVVLWMRYPSFLRLEFILYAALTLCFTLLLAFDHRLKLPNVTSSVIGLQFLFEILIEAGIIYATGNVNSPFSALFILTIVSAALAYGLVGTLLMASLVSVGYAFIIWLGLVNSGHPTLSVQALKTVFLGEDNVFYSVFLHILIFYLVAFISGYLAQKLKLQNRELAVASQALKKARLETDDILRHVSSGLLTIDAQGSLIYFNRAAERILGYREEDVKGMACCEVFAERMPELAESLMDGIKSNIQYPRREITIINDKQVGLPLGLSTSILTEDAHILRGVIAIFSDLTEAKALEAKARTADRLAAIGELSASIAHEIRNPLASISGSVEVLKQELRLDGQNAKLMTLIVKESHRLSKILSEFLSYARIDRPAYNKVELCHLLSEVIDILVHHDSYHRGIGIGIESDESFVYVIGDDDLLKQVLLNLSVNACEAIGPDGGEVVFRVTVNRENNAVELCIRDTGGGISTEDIKRIYQPFFSTKRQGTGLGLSVVHRICSAMRVNVSVTSAPGEGTTFHLDMPLFSPAALSRSRAQDTSEESTALTTA